MVGFSEPRIQGNVDLSILIPTYEMGSVGGPMLERALSSIAAQTGLENVRLEVVVADQSRNNDVLVQCLQFMGHEQFALRYFRNRAHRGSGSANLNFAFRKSAGPLIKILLQDDFLFREDAMSKILEAFRDNDSAWLAVGCNHTANGLEFSNNHIPSWHDQIHLEKNTISSPSVIALRRRAWKKFDPALIWLMDVDFYKRATRLI